MSAINTNPNAGTVSGSTEGLSTGDGGSTTAAGSASHRPIADVGAMLAAAGVVLPTVESADSQPVMGDVAHRNAKSPRAHTDGDTFDTTERPPVDRSKTEIADRGAERNPFDGLQNRNVLARRRELARSFEVDTEIDIPVEAQGKVLSVGKKLMGEGVERASEIVERLAEGMLLVNDDAQGAAARRLGQSKTEVQNEVRRLLSDKERTRHMKRISTIMEQIKLSRIGTDPQSFVMRVMREAYAIGNEQMKDYAERLKKTNSLRESIRKEAQRTRDALLNTAGMEEDEHLDVPFDQMSVDATAKQLTEAFYSVEEIAAQEAAAELEFDAEAEAVAPWDKPDGLTEGERRNLRTWEKDDDDIERNLGAIKEMSSRASIAEFDEFIYPTMVRLARKDDETELVELLGALPPYLMLHSRRRGAVLSNALDGRQGDDYQVVQNAALDALSEESGVPLHALWFDNGAHAALEAYEAAMLASEESEPQNEVGERKQSRTVGELRNYEKYLEDALNSAGEDGQMLNLELQNQLQQQQQQLQMMSNMSKSMHDVGMGILRNVGA